jgi:hypothetical protein
MAMGAAEESVRRVGKGGSSSSSTKGKWKKGGFGWGSVLRPRGNGGQAGECSVTLRFAVMLCGLSSSGRVTWPRLPSGTSGLKGVLGAHQLMANARDKRTVPALLIHWMSE